MATTKKPNKPTKQFLGYSEDGDEWFGPFNSLKELIDDYSSGIGRENLDLMKVYEVSAAKKIKETYELV